MSELWERKLECVPLCCGNIQWCSFGENEKRGKMNLIMDSDILFDPEIFVLGDLNSPLNLNEAQRNSY